MKEAEKFYNKWFLERENSHRGYGAKTMIEFAEAYHKEQSEKLVEAVGNLIHSNISQQFILNSRSGKMQFFKAMKRLAELYDQLPQPPKK